MDGPARPNGECGGSGEPLRRVVVIANPLGLHLRAAGKFAAAALRCRSTVVLRNNQNNRQVNGKSMTDLLLLNAPLGTELTLEVAGEDASTALPLLAEILGAPSADDVGGRGDVPALGL